MYIEKYFDLLKDSQSENSSIPSGFKFIKEDFETLVGLFQQNQQTPFGCSVAKVLSFASIVCVEDYKSETIAYYQKSNRNFLKEMPIEYLQILVQDIQNSPEQLKNVLTLEEKETIIGQYFQKQNQINVVDFVITIKDLGLLKKFIDIQNIYRIMNYLIAVSQELESQDEAGKLISFVFEITIGHKLYFNALRCAIYLNNPDLIHLVY